MCAMPWTSRPRCGGGATSEGSGLIAKGEFAQCEALITRASISLRVALNDEDIELNGYPL